MIMLSERLKDIRENSDKTQSEMAKELNVARSTYAGWENNIDSIPLTKLNDFCDYFSLSLDYVCGLTNNREVCKTKKEINKEVVGKNLKLIRTKNNDTQDYISKIINIDRSQYSRYETGKYLITTSILIPFCKHYDISIDFICGKKSNPKITKK